MRKIKSFVKGILNLIIWFPVIWKDRNYHYNFLLFIMRKKLQLMENFFRSDYATDVDAIDTANSIKYSIDILNRIIEDCYLDKSLLPFCKKYPSFSLKENWDMRMTEEARKFFVSCSNEAYEEETLDYKNLFTSLENNIRLWWD